MQNNNGLSFRAYQILAGRTLPDLGEKLNLTHMVLGMNSELSELEDAFEKNDFINVIEEICDYQWYLANYCSLVKFNFGFFDNVPWKVGDDGALSMIKGVDTTLKCIQKLYYLTSKLQDLVKKNIAYSKPILREVEIEYISLIQEEFQKICILENLDINKGLENNINKLKIRYPDKFTQEAAINRNLEAERIELEK